MNRLLLRQVYVSSWLIKSQHGPLRKRLIIAVFSCFRGNMLVCGAVI
jgi:hypothetical protein